LSPNTSYYFDVGASNAAGTNGAKYQFATTQPLPCPWVIDHPVADDTNGNYYPYAVVNGTLFGPNGPVYTDVQQTNIGDCWLLASFAEAAARAPQDIQRMFTDLGTYMENGVQVHVWSVHFYDTTGVSRSVIVDNELPVTSSGKTMSDNVLNGVLWAALAEKAYIQAAALGYVALNKPADNSYMSINGGDPSDALAAITGLQATDVSIDASGIDYDFSVGDLVVLGTGSTTSSSLIIPDHCYAVINDNPTATYQYTVFNPWNAGATTTWEGNTVYGSTFYCDADFINANWEFQGSAEA
jgi:Calpain family cysteine protease